MASNSINILIEAKDNATRVVASAASNIRDASNNISDSGDRAARSTSGFSTQLGSLANTVMHAAAVFGAYKLEQAVSGFIGDSVSTAAKLEQTNMAFQSLIGNSKEASHVFAEAIQYANTTPFESKDIIQASQTLMGFGTAGQQTIDIVKQLGDVTAVSGGDLNALSLVTGQVFSQGKMRAQDMYQLINDGGAGVLKIMAANAGGMKNLTDEFQNGGIPAQAYFDAINEATAKGGFAFEGANKQADTFNGRLSTLKDTVTQFGMKLIGVKIDPQLGYVIESGGLFDKAKGIISSLNDELGKLDSKQVLGGIEAIAGIAAVIASYMLLSASIKGVIGVYRDLRAAKDWIVDVSNAALDFGKAGVSAAKTFATKAAEIAGSAKDLSIKMGTHAASAGSSWIKAAGNAAVEWGKQLAQITKFTVTEGPKIAARAVDAGAAWVINAIRASFVWVTQELPRIVKAMAVTAVESTKNAAIASAAWVRSAVAASYAWVTQELPKIVRSFVVTSGSAVANAAVSSSAWVRGAAVAAFAWVTTEMPQIVRSFVVTAAAAVTSAAVASGAWVAAAARSSAAWIASAVTTSQTFGALSALIATPLVMPAIVVAAALGSIALVVKAAYEAKGAIDAMNNAAAAQDAADASNADAINRIQHSNMPASWKAQKISEIGNGGHALGTSFAPGGLTMVGENGPELVNMPRGSQVYNAKETQQVLGGSRGAQLTINGGMHIHNQLDEKAFLASIGWRLATA